MSSRTTRAAAVLLAALAAAAAAAPRPAAGAAQAAPPIDLKPLPDAPRIDAAREALPGSGGELAVVAARPRGVALGNFRPTITFSKPVVALGTAARERSLPPPAAIDPPIAGEWRWIGSASAEFVAAGPFPYSTAFTVTVPAGLRAVDGSALALPYSSRFETPRPELQRVQPADGWRWLGPREAITLLFNQPVADLAGHLRLDVGGDAWPVEVSRGASLVEERRAGERDRRYARQALGERASVNRQTRYVVTPARPLPLDRDVALVIAAGLRGVDGPLAMDAAQVRFRTYGPMRVDEMSACNGSSRCPFGPLVLATSNPADVASLRSLLALEPAVKLDWEHAHAVEPLRNHLPRVYVPGKFRPGTRYEVRIAAGLEDAFGQAAPEARGTIETSHLDASFDPGAPVALLEAAGDGALPVDAVNLHRLKVKVWRLSPADLARLGVSHRDRAPLTGAPAAFDLDVSAAADAQRTVPLPIRPHLGGSRSGLFYAEVDAPELNARYRSARTVVGQLTDLAVHAKLGATSGVVWVTRLSTGAPVPRADLALHDAKGEVRWLGGTNLDGVAVVPGLAVLGLPPAHEWDSAPYALVAASTPEGDLGVTMSTWTGALGPWAFDLPADWDGTEPRSLGTVLAERGIYRPGETVHLKGVARVRRLGRVETPAPGSKLRLVVRTSRGKEVVARDVATTAYGTFSASFDLPADVPLGTFGASATGDVGGGAVHYGGSFRVEEYRPPQFRVEVDAPARDLAAGDALGARVLARYLFGGAMAGAEVRWSVNRSTTDFTPPGNAGFTFGVQSWWWDDDAPARTSEVFGAGSATTDAQGGAAFDAGKVEAPAGRTWEYVLEAEVADVNRQRLASRAAVTVHPASWYAGVRRRDGGFAEAGKRQVLEAVAVSPVGAREAGVPLTVAVKRREWKSIRKKGAGDHWSTVSEAVEETVHACRVASAAAPVECAFTPDRPGLYVAEVTLTDRRDRKQATRAPFYVVGSGWVSWQRGEGDRLDVVADKPLYDVGETARLLVKSPFPEAEALLTVEREGVMSARRVRLSGAATTLEVPLGDDAVPNVFASVVLVRGRVSEAGSVQGDPGRPAVRVGYVQLKVERRSKRLDVAIAPDAAQKRPRDKVRVDLRVTDARGAPAQAEVAVWAVDEGVLRLTGYKVPDPVEIVHPPRGLSVRLGEPLVHLVERRRYGEKGLADGGSGGGDASGAGFRSRFATTVLFAPEVATDADGRAQVEFELPDNLTTYRIMALAVTRGDLLGTGAAQVAVAKPLLALPALPRLARVGDRFEAGVVVHAPGATISDVEVTAEARGLALEGPAVRRATLAGGRPREVRFAFRADAPGEAVLRFAVRGGAERDGVEQRIRVELPVGLEAVAVYGEARGARREGFAPPEGVRPDVGGLELSLASTALGGLSEGMRQLVEYPFGCLEQLSSRLVPFIALRELGGAFGVRQEAPTDEQRHARDGISAWFGTDAFAIHGASDPDEVVRRTVKTIEALQNGDGGYRYWASDPCSAEWASAYAVLALGRAAEVGYPVDRAALARGQAYLADVVAAGRASPCDFWRLRVDPAARAFAVYALARTGAPRASYYGELFAARKELPRFAQAMLADAMFVGGGDRAQAGQLLAELMNDAKESPSEVHLEEADSRSYAALWSSDARTTAIALQTLADVSPDHPYVPRMAAWLVKARRADGTFRNTQESAFALMALVEVVRARERDVPDFTARAALGATTLAEHLFRGRSLEIARERVPMARLPRKGGPLAFDFERQGPAGVLYYGALLRYAPVALPKDALDRGLVVQRWFEPYEGGGQVRALRAGDLVRVRVRVASHMERNYVAVDVPLPSGLEAVDTTLASTAALRASAAEEGPRRGYAYDSDEDAGERDDGGPSWQRAFWSPFGHVEQRDDRVVLFADRLPPGVHVASFVARATTPGEFVLKPARAEEMYTPEVFGRSDGGTFRVVDAAPVAER